MSLCFFLSLSHLVLIKFCGRDVFLAGVALFVRVEVFVVLRDLRPGHGLVAEGAEENVAGAVHRVHAVVGHRNVALAEIKIKIKQEVNISKNLNK